MCPFIINFWCVILLVPFMFLIQVPTPFAPSLNTHTHTHPFIFLFQVPTPLTNSPKKHTHPHTTHTVRTVEVSNMKAKPPSKYTGWRGAVLACGGGGVCVRVSVCFCVHVRLNVEFQR